MADLGVEVKLEPKLNRADFESAVKGMKLELPVEVNTRALTSSINSAIDSVKAHKLKIGVDTTYLSSQISKVLQAQLGTQATSNSATKAATQQTAQLRAAQAQVSKMQRSVANMNIGGKLGTDKLQNLSGQFESAVNGFNDAKNSAEGFQAKLDDVTRSYQDLLAAQKRQATDNTNERRLQRESQHLANIQRQARELIENNPRVLNTSLYGQLNDIINRASGGQSNSVELSRDLANVRSEMERLGVTSENVGQRISRLFRDHFNTAIAMAGLHLLQNSLQEIVTSVIDVDTAMTDLQKVSNATSAEYASFLEGAEGRAKSLGATITDVIGATSEFSRLGYNLDESSTLGDAAVKYLNVSEYTNIEDAAQSLVSTMQAFNIEADQVGSIVDKFNEIGNNYAISSQGLGEAMQRSAAALSLAGNTLDESLALVTAANEVVQDPDVVGTWAKTLTMYLRAAKADAEAAGVETEGMANSVSELRDSILDLTNNQVDIMADDTTFKSTVQIMREIAGVYDSMTDLDQAALLELLSGKRQANTTAALLSNWQTVEEAIQSSMNSLGSADAENEKYLNSIEGHIAQFQAQFQATTTSILDSEFLKGTIDTGSGLLGAVQWLTENLGAIPGLITPITSLLASSQNFNLFTTKRNTDGSTSIQNAFERWREYSQSLQKQTEADVKMLRDYFSGGETLTGEAFERAFASGSSTVRNYAKSIDVATNSAEQLNQRVQEFEASQKRLSSLGSRLGNFATNLGANLLASFGSMAAWTAIASAVSLAIQTIDGLMLSSEEAAEITSNVTQAFQQSSQEIENNISSAESLRDRFDELSKGVSDTGQNISLSTDEYAEYRDIVSELTSMSPAIIQGYNAEGDAIINKNTAIQQTIDLLKQQRVEEARQAVYGGTTENDGRVTNYQAAYRDFENQYDAAQRDIQSSASDVADTIQDIYNSTFASSAEGASGFQKAIGDAIGISYEDFANEFANEFGSSADMSLYIGQNFEAIADNLPQILNNLRDMGLLTNNVATQIDAAQNSYSAVKDATDSAADSLRTMIQAVYESEEGYYNLGSDAKSFLEVFKNNISADTLSQIGEEGALELTTALVRGLENDSQVRFAAAQMYDLFRDRDTMRLDEYEQQMRNFAVDLQNALGIDFDLSGLFGIDDYSNQIAEYIDTIKENFSAAVGDAEIEATIDGSKVDIDVDDLLDTFDFADLTAEQLRVLNNVLTQTGDRAGEFAIRMAAIAEAGYLPEFLDNVTSAFDDQAGSIQTVTGALADYQKEIEGLTTARSTHENMAAIYDEFAQAVQAGSINSEYTRNQMEFLTGRDDMSLAEARQWINSYKGFYQVSDEDNLTKDITSAWESLQAIYNQMSAEQRATVDALANIDFNTGSIQVAGHDVEALAEAFGMSAATLQDFLDVTGEYSNYFPPTMEAASDAVQTLNDDIYRLSQSLNDTQKANPIWDELSVEGKNALESFAEGLNIDPSKMNFSEVENLVSALNTLKAALGEDVSTDGLISALDQIKTETGDAAAAIQQTEDGWSIDITNIEAVAAAWNTTEDAVRQSIAALGELQTAQGEPVTITVNGQPAIDTTAETATNVDNTMAAVEEAHDINIDTSKAQSTVNAFFAANDGKVLNWTIRVSQSGGVSISGGNSGSGGSGGVDAISGAGYAGITGKMTSMASGGQSHGGKTLVGELGRELWISRDGKRRKIVGKDGMEIINMRRGDAIVPNNVTEQLIRGGLRNAAGGVWGGTNGSYGGALQNALNNAKSGTKSNPSSATVKLSADTSDIEESMEDTLKELKERIDDIFNDLEHEIYLLQHNGGGLDEILARYKKIQEEAHRQAEQYRSMGLDANSEYIQDMQKQWWDAKDAMADAIAEFYEPLVSDRENAVTLTENWLENAITDGDVAKAEKYANDIIGYYTQMQNVIHEQAEYYRSLGFSDTSDEVSELSDQWWEYAENIQDVKQQVIDGLNDIVSATSDAIDSLQDVFDTLKDAADEYAETGGFISVDSFQAIMELGPEYMQYLRDENGLLAINEESINRVIAAKTEQLALENAMAYVERLRLAMQEGSIEDLNQLLYATTAATDATWGMVYANLALLGLNGDQYQAALHNINALYSLAQNTMGGVGIDFDSMKSGVDDLIDYVMDMIQDQVEEQIDALEEMKEKYAEIIQLKKDSLDASREESDYQESVAEQIQEIADLQAQINRLSLDDSRSAQAQKAQLEEQLAELQKQLSDDQADYAYDNQVDSLDKMQEAYEDEKDKEIEVLQDSISSTQKLYDAAISYIKNNWGTLYDELIAWNTEMGSSINSEITEAWRAASEAVKQYGGDVEAALNQYGQGSSASSSGSSGSSSNNIVGDSTNGPSNEQIVRDIVGEMKENAAAWRNTDSQAERDRLDRRNYQLGNLLHQYGIDANRNEREGVWYFDGGTKRLFDYYHTGGIAGTDGTLKQKEMMAVLEKGEVILDQPKQNALMRMIESIGKMSKSIGNNLSANIPRVFSGLFDGIGSPVHTDTIVSAAGSPSIQVGDTIIYGADDDTVRKHQEISRKQVNDILDIFHLKK